jgi:hypothetical protein
MPSHEYSTAPSLISDGTTFRAMADGTAKPMPEMSKITFGDLPAR